jgi:DnaJ-class molecular chaperone
MYRTIIILAILAAAAGYVRYQFHKVVGQITIKPTVTQPATPSPDRRKCLMCGGTGQIKELNGLKYTGKTKPCVTCNGTGWIEPPSFAR